MEVREGGGMWNVACHATVEVKVLGMGKEAWADWGACHAFLDRAPNDGWHMVYDIDVPGVVFRQLVLGRQLDDSIIKAHDVDPPGSPRPSCR